MRRLLLALLLTLCTTPLLAQSEVLVADEPHGIDFVDEAPLGGSIATPLPENQRRRMKKYDIPELVGARQALGSQLIDGRLPRPLFDYVVHEGAIDQRISMFEGGLVVVKMTGAGGTIRKRLIIPDDALTAYRRVINVSALDRIGALQLVPPRQDRKALFRVYGELGFVERTFDPSAAKPKQLHDQLLPLEDLLRAISEDRTVTNTVANYQPKIGDILVGDDRKSYRVARIIKEAGVVELRCINQPTSIYVAEKDLYNYFIGSRRSDAE